MQVVANNEAQLCCLVDTALLNPTSFCLWLWFCFPYFFFFLFACTVCHVKSWFPDQGPNSCPLHCNCGVLTTGPLGKSLHQNLTCLYCFEFVASSQTLRNTIGTRNPGIALPELSQGSARGWQSRRTKLCFRWPSSFSHFSVY